MKTRTKTTAFTLVELLTVIVIISLLLMILVPTVSGIIKMAYNSRCTQRIKMLEHGTYAYYEDTGRRYFPGQQYPSLLRGDGGVWTGSQYLSRCLFFKKNGVFPGAIGADPTYCSFSADLILWDQGSYGDGDTPTKSSCYTNLALSDGFPDCKAICYYVSRPRTASSDTGTPRASLAQFRQADNFFFAGINPYYPWGTVGDPMQNTAQCSFLAAIGWDDLITNTSFSTYTLRIPYRDREFLLMAAGVDRGFYSIDDCTNFK